MKSHSRRPIGKHTVDASNVHGVVLETKENAQSVMQPVRFCLRPPWGSCTPGELHVRIVDEFVCDAGVEVFVAFRHLLKADHLDIDDLGDRQSVPK
jgi:hypothetical protein